MCVLNWCIYYLTFEYSRMRYFALLSGLAAGVDLMEIDWKLFKEKYGKKYDESDEALRFGHSLRGNLRL